MKGDAIGAVWRSKRGKDLPTIAILRRDPASKMVIGVTADRTELRIPRDQLKAEWVFVASSPSWFVNEETVQFKLGKNHPKQPGDYWLPETSASTTLVGAQAVLDFKGGRL